MKDLFNNNNNNNNNNNTNTNTIRSLATIRLGRLQNINFFRFRIEVRMASQACQTASHDRQFARPFG